MLRRLSLTAALFAASLVALALPVAAQQAPLFEEIRTLSSSAEPVTSEPFTVTTAGTYNVALADLGAQLSPTAPLASVQLAVMRGATVAGTLTQPGATALTLAPGTYVVRVTGSAGTGTASGLFSVAVRATGATQDALAFTASLSPRPAIVPSNVAVFQGSATLPAAGNYIAEMEDFAFPAALANGSLIVTQGSGVLGLPLQVPGTPAQLTQMTSFPAAAGPIALYAVADSPSATNAGLLAIRIRDAGTNAIVYSHLISVGRVAAPASAANVAAGSYTMMLADLGFPAALTQSAAIATRDSVEVARRVTPGSSAPFTVASAGSYQVHVLAVPGTTPAAGSAAVELRGATTPYSAVATVGGDAATSTPIFSYAIDVPTAGTHTARASDLQFPTALAGVQMALVQSAAVIARRDTAGTVSGPLAQSRAHLLVYATAAATTGTLQQRGGLFSADLTPTGGNAVFQATQGVGGLFNSRSFVISTPGDYRFTVNDVGFPAPFAEFAAAVTRGGERLGLLYGQGSFDVLAAPTGTYFINFIARVDATLSAGTYRVAATTKPASPDVTLSATPLSPANGATTTLTWSAQNATTCTASGAWSGVRATSGTEQTAAINTATIYTLACTGDGGTTTKTLSVTPAVPTNASGGGGSMDLLLLTLLGALLAAAGVRAHPRIASRR
jgi:hypothetical protein